MEPRHYSHLNVIQGLPCGMVDKQPQNDLLFLPLSRDSLELLSQVICHKEKFGQLVLLGFDVTAFTPAAYQRRSLQRPSKEI